MSQITPLDPDEADDEAVGEFLPTAVENWYEDAACFGVIVHASDSCRPDRALRTVPAKRRFRRIHSTEFRHRVEVTIGA